MRKYIFLFLAATTLMCCQKKDNPAAIQQEVTFQAIEINPDNGQKSTNDWICKDLEPDYAVITIGGADFTPAVYRLNGQLYTQSLKFAPGSYIVTKFLLYDDHNTPGNLADDEIVYGTPQAGSDYAIYTSIECPFSFSVSEFEKLQVPTEVLCFMETEYDSFGFDWFVIDRFIIREQCFFGDFCIKHPADYNASNYANQAGWPQTTVPFYDAPAIFKIMAYKMLGTQWVLVPYNDTFTNNNATAGWGVGAPVCVQYADNLDIDDEQFKFELWIYVKTGSTYTFKKFKTWIFEEDEMIPAGADGVVDFVLGSCNASETDLQLPPYQNLPITANVTIEEPGDLPSYWDIRFNSYYPAGSYDIPDVVSPFIIGWCGDDLHFIGSSTFNAYIYTSLNNENWPVGMPFTLQKISMVNWLMNHLGNYSIDILNFTDAEGLTIQGAIWNIVSGSTYPGISATMATDASAHGDFVPLPGGWAAVLIIKNNEPTKSQLVFVVVDP